MVIIFLALNSADFSRVMGYCLPPWGSAWPYVQHSIQPRKACQAWWMPSPSSYTQSQPKLATCPSGQYGYLLVSGLDSDYQFALCALAYLLA